MYISSNYKQIYFNFYIKSLFLYKQMSNKIFSLINITRFKLL